MKLLSRVSLYIVATIGFLLGFTFLTLLWLVMIWIYAGPY